jgi:predicted nucleic acid-binding protein
VITLDANVLVYAVDTRDHAKHQAAIEIVAAAAAVPSKLGLQVIGEFFVASTRKVRTRVDVAHERVRYLLDTFEVFPHTRAGIAHAAAEAAAGHLSYWDAVLLASAEEAGCTAILSEDMADGSRLGELSVHNPFGLRGISDAAKRLLQL